MKVKLSRQVELAVNQPKVLTDYPALNDHKTAEMQFKRRIISDTQMLEQVLIAKRILDNSRSGSSFSFIHFIYPSEICSLIHFCDSDLRWTASCRI